MHPNAQPLEEAQRQLSLMLHQQEELAPALYRDLALYLQVLREGLLPAVQQACFHLATQVVPERYARLPQERRRQFQQRLVTLVQRCTALLTVEQLMGLAAQQHRRDHRRQLARQQRLLQAFLEGSDDRGDDGSGSTDAADGADATDGGAFAARPVSGPVPGSGPGPGSTRPANHSGDRRTQDPAGSIHLGLDLPVAADLFDRGIAGLPPAARSARPDDHDHPEAEAADRRDDDDVGRHGPSSAGASAGGNAPSSGASGGGTSPAGGERGRAGEASATSGGGAADGELKLLQSLFQMAAQGLGEEGLELAAGLAAADPAAAGIEPGEGRAITGAEAPGLELRVMARPPGEHALDPAVTGSALPRDPLLQVSWWRHFDRALSRRLRNLSHALNVEMMRLGLAQGLLPLNLLDAVLEGQVEALPAPANLLRLPLPLPDGSGSPTEVLTLLLRSTDLEFEQPRLRTCRRRLEQRRRALRTMAKRYRIWQRRVTALEAEQQWFRDSAQPQSQPLEPS